MDISFLLNIISACVCASLFPLHDLDESTSTAALHYNFSSTWPFNLENSHRMFNRASRQLIRDIEDTMDKFWESLKPGSSEIDWCEPNYVVTSNIAEFFNTISNIIFLVIPPLLIVHFRQYAACISPSSHLVWVLLIAVGLFSAYFHATLSLMGQLLDEFAILWVIMAATAIWFPKKQLPACFRQHVGRFKITVLLVTIIGTILGLVNPYLNAFIMLPMMIPIIIMMIKEIKRSGDASLYRLGMRSIVITFIAISIWISDRAQCDMWLRLNFPYLHAIWHVLALIAAYQACVFGAYLETIADYPEYKPELKYWPFENFEGISIPVIRLKPPLPY